MQKRLKKMQKRLRKMQKRLNTVQERLKTTSERLETMQKSLKTMQKRLKNKQKRAHSDQQGSPWLPTAQDQSTAGPLPESLAAQSMHSIHAAPAVVHCWRPPAPIPSWFLPLQLVPVACLFLQRTLCFAEERGLSSTQTVSGGCNAEGVVHSGVILLHSLWQAYWQHKQPLELHRMPRN